MSYPPADDRLRHLIAQELNPHVDSWKFAFWLATGLMNNSEIREELERIVTAHANNEPCGDRNCKSCWRAHFATPAP
ncbi:hypothetical protein [Streptomyces sp. NPDC059828]|uniref:hypothetical protein n=1 Tax=Streptomyces sp. NPDC059828 TaxID=3346965 RepID=UPI0036531053